MLDLYRIEAEDQTHVLTTRLLELERTPTAPDHLEACMRAAHSLKGAARIIGFDQGVKVAHAMEDCFVAAQHGTFTLNQEQIDAFLRDIDILRNPVLDAGVDTTRDIRATPLAQARSESVDASPTSVRQREPALSQSHAPPSATSRLQPGDAPPVSLEEASRSSHTSRVHAVDANLTRPRQSESVMWQQQASPLATSSPNLESGMLRVTAEHLNRLLRLAGETLVEARRLKQGEEHAHRLYEAALACRMRPFRDGVQAFPRMVRDLARSLGKRVRLEIKGEWTQVDRDILARLEAPLGHLLRNAVDHGIETPEERSTASKPSEAVITLEARHSAGTLQVSVSDDGRGINLDEVRKAVVRRSLSTSSTVTKLSESELLEFLFLPGFTLKETVTEVSGRGVGLDVVQDVLKQVRGTVRTSTQQGKGTRFQLQLPLTLSVDRTLLVEIGREPYALPLAQVARTARIPRSKIEHLAGRPHFFDGNQSTGLIAAHTVLGVQSVHSQSDDICVVQLGSHERACALGVDRFLGQRELVIQPLDPRLGKVQHIAAAAVMEDGSPILILDVEDLIRSAEKLAGDGGMSQQPSQHSASDTASAAATFQSQLVAGASQPRRVLVVDDSLTVRELERKVLMSAGFEVDVATDGMDGWNAVRAGAYDLIVTDIDMPRMDGIELVQNIRKDPTLQSLPVMIVSYKDRPEDRRRGLEAGADHYLGKASFHDDALVGAVRELLGDPARDRP